ncbi:hypothetical protein DFH29DRAFT_880030 [Suillus ampliporus]|nr:hypothetical protein DFH29DRAFT_880030 [Suillus ampliporus]
MDGNFKAEHLYPANLTDEVALTHGLGFMVNVSHHKLKATGIVSQRQMNMDYALCQALAYNTNGIDQALTFYDINYQYHKHLNQQIEEPLYIDLPWGMDIVPGIRLWHVQGHQDKCYICYTSNFITSAARINGEIMGTLWVPLNIISPSMIHMSKFLRRKFKEAVQGVQDSQYAFNQLSETAEDDTLAKWEAEATATQDDRLHNPGTMDIYEVQLTKAPTRKQQELHLLNHQAQWPTSEIHHGAATWLASGIILEEEQLDGMTVMLDTTVWDSVGSSDDDPDQSDEDEDYDLLVKFKPKTVVIPLPSNIDIKRCTEWGVADLVLQEISLREGQANDVLHAIRVNLADKAVLFCTMVQSAKSQARSNRAWACVHSVDKILYLNTQIYSKCCKQLIHLGANDLLTKYQPLEKADLKATMVVADLNMHSQRNSTLAWFWSIDVQGDSTNNDWMNEFYCVHWLWMLALRDHWAEELLLVG